MSSTPATPGLLALTICGLFAGLTAQAAPAPAGKKAFLTVNVEIDGSGAHASKSDGVDVKWSTRRRLSAKVELIAEKATTTGMADAKAQAAAVTRPGGDMQAMQKKVEKCGDNQACQMAAAMEMMQSADGQKMIAQARAADAASPRYQIWKVVPKAKALDLKLEYAEQWDGVFLTASRETRTCKISLASAAALGAKAREQVEQGLSGFAVEVDTQTGSSSLLAGIAAYAPGELQCHINDGGKVFDERSATMMSFAPPLDTKTNGGWIAGSASSGTTLARGDAAFTTSPGSQSAESASQSTTISAPLKVKLRWELTPQ
ncbi:MAG: hypothetical protein ABL964_11465 [Steroidobacteraceae bacterium]